jgi:D-arginine dehydrogenase
VSAWDVVVVGGGIAGASAAACLAEHLRVVVLEREAQPGYHATGRSAALFSEIYGGPPVRALSRASRAFFRGPPAGFADAPLATDRGSLFVARSDQTGELDDFVAQPDVARRVRRVSPAEARALVPILRPDYVAAAAYEREAADLDVHGLHHGYLRLLRARGGDVRTSSDVVAIEATGTALRVRTEGAAFEAPVVVNAAGAWADEVAEKAGAAPLGLEPRRRTALTVDAPEGYALAAAPMTIDVGEHFYFKPDAGRLLLSPADETKTAPCDAKPDDLDVAIAVDRVERATVLEVRRIVSKWAGLRTFARDRAPVVGFDAGVPGFFWLAGQGGYGIQTAPALARLVAALVRRQAVPGDIADTGLRLADISPARLATA